jgi:hypothetical protein
MKRFGLSLFAFVLLISGFSNTAANSNPSQPETLPAPISGAPLPTLQVTPNHGQPGAALVATGHGVSPYPGVRLAWLDEDTTATLKVVNLDGSGNYNAAINIPATIPPGAGRVCAAVTGASQAAFQCVNITIDTPNPGSVSGTVPSVSLSTLESSADFNASLNLYDQQGNVIASALIQSNGSYNLGSVPPGVYTAGVSGSVPVLVQNGTVVVQSGQQATFNPVPFNQCTKGSVIAVRLTPSGKATSSFDFGSYVNYWPYTEAGPKVDFEVDMQVLNGATLGLMAVKYDHNGGGTAVFAAVDPPVSGATYAFSRWLADVDVGIRHFSFEPGVSNAPSGCVVQNGTSRVHVIEHPMQDNALQYHVDRRVTDLVWDGSQYVFDVKLHSSYDSYDFLIPIINIEGERKLPVTFPDPPPNLDYIGTQENKMGGAALNAVGTMDLDGNVTIEMLRMRSRSSPMNLPSIINGIAPLLPEGSSLPLRASFSQPNRGIPIFSPQNVGTDLVEKLRQLHYDIPPTTLFDFDEHIPVYEGVLFSAAGLVNLRISIVLGINGDMVYQGTIRPLAPAVSALAETNIRPNLDVEVILDALFGVASAGGTAHTQAEVRLPVEMDSADSRFIWMPDPCFSLTTTFYMWVRANIGFASKTWYADPQVLVDYHEGTCQSLASRIQSPAAPQQDPPRVLAAPQVASGPGGRLLAVYVEDSTPAATNPAPKVMARFWDIPGGQWGTATALTDGTRMVQDPVAAFYGPDGRAMVVWTQNPITPAEEQAAGNDLNLILKRQEIYYATFNGSVWSAPIRFTNDQLPDGHAAVAGDDQGITLAWLQDTDGNLATRLDWRIAVREWTPGSNSWSSLVLLNGSTTNASNYQVQVDRQVVSAVSQRVLAWTVDADGDLGTTGDRSIVVFDWNGAIWVKDPTNSLPLRAESPQVGYIPGGQDLYLAYLVHNNDTSGSNGGQGNLGVLQTARRDFGGTWSKFGVLDENGDPVRAEQPRLDVGQDGQALVLIRRFGQASTNGELGQIAYSPLKDTGEAFPPLYLTDEAQQNWQPALAINQDNLQAVFLNVGRDLPALTASSLLADPLKPAASGVHPEPSFVQLTTDNDPLESAVILPGADPALDPVLQVSQYHANPGETVVITSTVTNVGNAPVSGVSVGLFSGQYPGGSLIQSISVGDLDFNQSQTATFQVTAAAGSQPVYARVTASSQNIETGNDLASTTLGQLLPPEQMFIQLNPGDRSSLQVAWQAPANSGIGGFRILRGLASGGPYELVGETSRTLFSDLHMPSGKTYYYVVQTFDDAGAVSTYSPEVSADLPYNTVYLPAMRK